MTDNPLTTTAALDGFLLDCRARRLTSKSVSFYQQQLTPFVIWLQTRDVTALAAIDAPAIRAYLVTLEDRGLADLSIHAAARSIRAWLNWCVREESITESPMRKVRMPKVAQRVLPSFERGDLQKLLDACEPGICPERDRAIVLTLLDSGLRASELCALDWRDLDEHTGALRVRSGKGRRDRTAYIGRRTLKALARYRAVRSDGNPAMFVSLNDANDRLTYEALKLLLWRLGDRAGVAHCHPHTFRRTFALESLRNGCDLMRLAALMGHSDLQMLRRYLALVESDLAAAHRASGPVDGLLGGQR
jgi:integrase/recombinase XerC